jgi:hypothetical protein
MDLVLGTRCRVALAGVAAVLAVVSAAGMGAHAVGQTSVTLMEPSAPLLPEKFGEWKRVAAGTETPGNTFVQGNKDVLAECGLLRSQVGDYTRGGRNLHIEAMELGDRTGAYSAFTLMARPGMKQGRELGANDAVGADAKGVGAVLFVVGSSVVLVEGATAEDLRSLKPLAEGLPKVMGSRGVAPLLPRLAPAKGLVTGSVRYALGPKTYAAEGGVLQPGSLGWDKEPEVATALYDDARGKETVTLLLYPTPTIAGNFAKTIQDELPQVGARVGTAKMRREGPLVVVAAGSFPADEAQRMVENVHLSEMTFNQDVQPTFHIAALQTYSLLTNIAILSGVLMAGAVLLGLFLGVGRATFRVMRGKPAALEPEFLSLHLSAQNEPAQFHGSDSPGLG